MTIITSMVITKKKKKKILPNCSFLNKKWFDKNENLKFHSIYFNVKIVFFCGQFCSFFFIWNYYYCFSTIFIFIFLTYRINKLPELWNLKLNPEKQKPNLPKQKEKKNLLSLLLLSLRFIVKRFWWYFRGFFYCWCRCCLSDMIQFDYSLLMDNTSMDFFVLFL